MEGSAYSPGKQSVIEGREVVLPRGEYQGEGHDLFPQGEHTLGRIPNVPLGMTICPYAGDVVKFPRIDLHGDPLAVGVGEDIACRPRCSFSDTIISFLCTGDDLHELSFHADFRYGGRDGHA